MSYTKTIPLRITAAAMLLAAASAAAEQRPLWEAGLGAAAVSFTHYRGSDERHDWLLPAPYFVYRGKVLRADERRVRGLFYESERAELDVSVNGAPPVRDNDARRGMPDLDATLEIGPSLNVSLARFEQAKLQLRLPVRGVISSDFSDTQRVGWMFQPQLALDVRDVAGQSGWNFGWLFGPLFTDRHYNRHFYGVEPAFATAARPAYDAPGGYGGLQSIAAVSKRFPGYWVGGFLKWDSLHGAAYEDSPLVRSRQHLSGGIAIAWILGRSRTTVDWND